MTRGFWPEVSTEQVEVNRQGLQPPNEDFPLMWDENLFEFIRNLVDSWLHDCFDSLINWFNLLFQQAVWSSAWEQPVQAWNVELFVSVNLWTANVCWFVFSSLKKNALKQGRLTTIFTLSAVFSLQQVVRSMLKDINWIFVCAPLSETFGGEKLKWHKQIFVM